MPQCPNVPTFAELGRNGLEVPTWFGGIAPKNTPPAMVARLNDAVNRALKDPKLAGPISAQGSLVGSGTSEVTAG